MDHIRQHIVDDIKFNNRQEITGDILQRVLLDMYDRDVFLTQEEYDALVDSDHIDEAKIYYIYEDD